MIALQLQCLDEHSFEAWFKDSQACATQARIGLIECPYCGSTNVSRAAENCADNGVQREAAPVEQQDIHARAHEVAQQILEAVGKLRNYAEENFEDIEAEIDTVEAVEASADEDVAVDEDLTDGEDQPRRFDATDCSD